MDPLINTTPPKVTPKKPQREVETMDKMQLVEAMQWDHPTRTLDIGTINANATRALNKRIDQAGFQEETYTYLSAIKTSLRNVTRISSRVKRTAQRAIGQYIERLSVHNIDEIDNNNNTDATNATDTTNTKILSEVDRRLLNILCPAFSNKDLVESSKEEMDQEPDNPEGLEELDGSNDKKNEALSFLMSLLTAIHSTKLPRKTGMGLQVRKFIEQAQDFLPDFTEGRTTEEYAGSSFLRSAALQLSVELKKHYRNGAIDLCNKVKRN